MFIPFLANVLVRLLTGLDPVLSVASFIANKCSRKFPFEFTVRTATDKSLPLCNKSGVVSATTMNKGLGTLYFTANISSHVFGNQINQLILTLSTQICYSVWYGCIFSYQLTTFLRHVGYVEPRSHYPNKCTLFIAA